MTCSQFKVKSRSQCVYEVDSSDGFDQAIRPPTLTDDKKSLGGNTNSIYIQLVEWVLSVIAGCDTSRTNGAWNARQGRGNSIDPADRVQNLGPGGDEVDREHS